MGSRERKYETDGQSSSVLGCTDAENALASLYAAVPMDARLGLKPTRDALLAFIARRAGGQREDK